MATAISDQSEWYTTDYGRCKFTIPTRYQDLALIGYGTFGDVIRATDTVTHKAVAIKKLREPFQSPEHAKRTYRELKFFTYLNYSDAQIVQLYNVFTPDKSLEDFQTLYFVFNFVDYDLHKVIRRRIPFTEDHIKQIIYSLLRGLKFIHSAGVIHRDLKPTNIAINKDSEVTILDFGLACSDANAFENRYVVTRWWRAPETFVHWERYNKKVDIWSIGCIMAELILLRPLFPGQNHLDQLNKIFDVMGTPDSATLTALCGPNMNALDYINGLPPRPKQDFDLLFGFKYDPASQTPISGVSSEGVDLLNRLLSLDHRKRPTAAEALSHPFLEICRDSSDEPTAQPMVDVHQDKEYTIKEWKSLIWEMIEEFQPPPWATENHADNS